MNRDEGMDRRGMWLVAALSVFAGCAGDSTYVPVPAPRQPGEPAVESPTTSQEPVAQPPTPQEPPPQPPPEETAQEQPAPAQSKGCTSGAVSFTARQPLTACAGVDLVVEADEPYAWVMVGIEAPSLQASWRGGATDVACGGGRCSWTFSATTVPCHQGPYTLRLMVDAKDDDPSKGRVVASCEP